MPSTPVASRHEGKIIIAIGVLWMILYFGVRFFLEANPELPRSTRLALAFVPTPVFAAFLWKFIKGLRSADELERRIQLEALAVAFPLGILLLTTLALVQRAVELKFEDWSYNHIFPYFILFYFVRVVLARRRYT